MSQITPTAEDLVNLEQWFSVLWPNREAFDRAIQHHETYRRETLGRVEWTGAELAKYILDTATTPWEHDLTLAAYRVTTDDLN